MGMAKIALLLHPIANPRPRKMRALFCISAVVRYRFPAIQSLIICTVHQHSIDRVALCVGTTAGELRRGDLDIAGNVGNFPNLTKRTAYFVVILRSNARECAGQPHREISACIRSV